MKALGLEMYESAPNTACTGRLVGPAKKASPGEQFFPFRWLVLPPAGNAHRSAAKIEAT